MKAWHKKKENRNKRIKERRKDIMKELTERISRNNQQKRGVIKKREYDRLWKEKSHKNQSRQKIQGIKLKDRNRTRKQHHPELYKNTQTPVNINSSTERVRKHRQRKKLIINYLLHQRTLRRFKGSK